MNYNYKVYYSRIGSEKIEEMTLTERDSITALLTFHASMQREHKLGRDDYQILRFHQTNFSDYDFPAKNPLITDDIINRLPPAARKRFQPPTPADDAKPTVDAGKAAGHRAG